MVLHAVVGLLQGLLLVFQAVEFFCDCVVLNISSQTDLIDLINVLVNPLQLLLELLDVLSGVGLHLLEHLLRPGQRLLLVGWPAVAGGFELHFRLDDVELVSQLVKFFVMDLSECKK